MSSRAGRCSRVPRRTVTCFRERSGGDEEVIFDGSYPAHLSSAGIGCKNRLKILELKEARSPRSGRCDAKNLRKPTQFHLGTRPRFVTARANKKEVKTGSFSPPGVGGVLHDKTLGGSAGLPCQAGLQPHSRTALGNSLGDSPPKSLSFCGL
jgi:hypothetical protein